MNFIGKHSFCFILNKRSDFVKLDLDENLRKHDRAISLERVTGAFEINGKTTGLPTGNTLNGCLG